MLYVALDWIYMATIMFVLGGAVLYSLHRWFLKEEGEVSLYHALICGYVVCTVYAEIICLFMRISIAANLLLIAITVCAGIHYKKGIGDVIKKSMGGSKADVILAITLVILIFGFLLTISGTPIMIFASGDTGFYHSQAVRWIEEYGTVPGLANLNLRFGFNNSNFCLAALFSMYELAGVSIRGTLTFFIGVVLVKAVYDLLHIRSHRYYVGDGIRALLLLYMLYKAIFLDGYCTDGMATFLVFVGALAYCDLKEYEKPELYHYGLICLLMIFTATVKLNVVPISVVAVIIMLIYLIREKKMMDIIKYAVCSLVIVVPWIIRNVIISGYLLFPFSGLDLFSVDWKVPIETVKRLELITYQFSKAIWYLGVSYEEAAEIGISRWFPKMFYYLFHSYDLEKVSGVMLIASIGTMIISTIVQVSLFFRKHSIDKTWMPLKLSFIVSLIFCISTGADVRYLSYVVFILPAILVLQYIDKENIIKFKRLNIMLYNSSLVLGVVAILAVCYLSRGAVASHLCYLQWHDYKQFLIDPGYVYTDADPSQYTSRMPSSGCVLREDAYAVANLEGLRIYYQTTTTNYHFSFYDPFPSVYSIDCLEQQYGDRVHARGAGYKDGFSGEFVGY